MSFQDGDPDLIAAVSRHFETKVGPIAGVLHEIVSDDLHIDLHLVASDRSRAFEFVGTSGMSERAMTTPPGKSEFRFAEVCILLKKGWSLDHKSFGDEGVYWPFRLLKGLARYPTHAGTWLAYSHTIAAADPPPPYASGTKLCAAVIVPSVTLGKEFWTMKRSDGATTYFLTVVPIHADELAFAMKSGSDALLDEFEKAGVTDVLDPTRPSALQRRS